MYRTLTAKDAVRVGPCCIWCLHWIVVMVCKNVMGVQSFSLCTKSLQ